ncbi:MAG TPA: DUF6519 domain-containing protein [Gaiellaceae bacterium]|nr:DUF6519 domain-containing protein [Gaiellaceae bacterium]
MAGDYTRLTFDPRRDRAMVLEQQGRVHLDADWNELVAILERRLRVETYDFAGPAVVPASEPDSFKIVVQGGTIAVTRGRIYVDGLLAENHGGGEAGYEPVWGESIGSDTTPLDHQPYLGSADAVKKLLKELLKGNFLTYLDVWQRELTVVEDPSVLEPALGVDTCTRVQTVWQIRALQLDKDAPGCGDDWSKYEPWLQATAPSAGRLTVQATQPPAPADPCAVAPVGGYRGKENRLYRVEVHDGGGSADDVTIKWSRDNGAVASRIVGPITDATTKPVVPVERLGRDDVLRFIPTDWVELLDDEHELDGRPGIIAQVDSVDQAQQTVTLTGPLGDTIDENRNPRIRRWDQTAGLANGVVPVAFGTPIPLEDGIEVTLTLDDPGGEVHTGDWWVFAARAATASVEELDEAPPRGIRHHYARLAILQGGKVVDDCRVVFPGECECEDGCACTVCVTPRSHGEDDGPLTIQNAIDRVAKTGGRVCLTAGSYPLKQPLRIEGARSLTVSGEGESTVISYVGDGLGIAVLDSVDVVLERFAIAVARASDKEFAAERERANAVVTNHLTMTNVPSFTAAPLGEQTIAIALVNTAACRVERCFAVSGFAPGAATSGLSINGSLGIGLGGWSIDTRIADNVVFGDVAVGDLTIGRAGVTTALAYDHVGLGTSYSANVDLEVTDNILLGLSAGIDLGSLPPRPTGARAVVTHETNIGPSLQLGLTRIVDNLVLGPRAVGIALVGAAAGAFATGAAAYEAAAPETSLETAETLDTAEPRVMRSRVGLETASATHTAAASLVLLGELFVRGLNRVDVVGNVLDLSGVGIAASPGNLRIEGNDITGETGGSRLGRGGGILLTLGSARQGRTVISDNAVHAVAGFGIGWSGAPGWLEVRGNRLAGVAGYGIAGAVNSKPDIVTIEDNAVEDVQIGPAGLAYAVQASGALVAEIRANRVRDVGTSTARTGGRAGILVSGCRTTSVTDNVLVAIGAAGEQAGLAYGIGYGGTLEVLDIRGNIVELSQGTGSRDIPLAITETVWKPQELGAVELGASDHLALLADSVRTENPAVLDPVFERARLQATVKAVFVRGEGAAIDPVPPGAGDVAVVDNTLRSSSVLPLALISVTANVTFAQNRVARAGRLTGTPGVLASARGAVIVSSNRVETAKTENAPASVVLSVDVSTKNEPHCTVLGNITSRPILLNGSSLQAPWTSLNIVA